MPHRIWTQTSHRLKPLREGRAVLLFLGLLFTVISAFFVVYPPDLIRLLNYRTYDALLTSRPVSVGSNVPVLIAIDDESLEKFGQWPWPRYRIAQMVERLRDLGAEAIALDMLMPEADRTSPGVIFDERERDLGESFPSNWLQFKDGRNDLVFADVLRMTPSILGYKLIFDEALVGQQPLPDPLQEVVVRREEGMEDHWPYASGIIASRDLLFSAARAGGFLNAKADSDGVLRRVPLLLPGAQGYYPSLALSTLLMNQAERGIWINQL